ncbi:MAG: hypothetical protein AAF721_18240 [Myxococcota bacterium]
MPLPRIASTLAFLTALTAVVGCDSETDLPEEIVLDRDEGDDDGDDAQATDTQRPATQTLAACEWLGADRSCGDEAEGIQFCAWLYNDETREVSTYWGECIAKPECSLWSCRDGDAALCDLVDGKPTWTPDACDY